ncbi:MAG TPA: type II toxin-antitoxin system VapC family toxin [Terriglobales bacterium]
MKRLHVLDANAVLDFFDNGPGSDRVEQLMTAAVRDDNPLLISVVNWGEVFYVSWQRRGEELARRTISGLSRLPIRTIPVEIEQASKAAEIKAVHKIPYVDCLAAALAEVRQAILVTSDLDFVKLGRRIPILWLARR